MTRASLCTLALLAFAASASADDKTPSYQRNVSALLSKLGCNGGTCHGAVQGQNGFKLSLFGADTEQDHRRLLHEFAGRRVNLNDPDASLLLLKGFARMPQQWGKRLAASTVEYELLRSW